MRKKLQWLTEIFFVLNVMKRAKNTRKPVFALVDKDYFKWGDMRTATSLDIVTGDRDNLPKIHTNKWTEKQRAKLSSQHRQLLQIQWPKSSYFHHMRHTSASTSIKTRALNSDQLNMTDESQQRKKRKETVREREKKWKVNTFI